MGKKNILTGGFLILLFSIFTAGGCRSAPQPSRPVRLSCEEQLGQSISDLKPMEISMFLDQAQENGTIENCWIPMIKKCLDLRREIPHTHVRSAVKTFNQVQHKEYFHKAVSRYFNDMIFSIEDENVRYRKQDRGFLTAYLRYLLRECTSRNCPELTTARQVCSRLDPDLYSKFFD